MDTLESALVTVRDLERTFRRDPSEANADALGRARDQLNKARRDAVVTDRVPPPPMDPLHAAIAQAATFRARGENPREVREYIARVEAITWAARGFAPANGAAK